MDIQTPEQTPPSPLEFDDILEATIEDTIPASQADTPERRARRLASARQQFAAYKPANAIEAQAAAFAIATMMGAIDSLARAAKPGVGGESAGRLRGNALAAGRFYSATFKEMLKRRQPDAEPQSKARAKSAPPPQEDFEPIPHLELFQPRDRRGKPIPRWRNDLMSKKQKDASYSLRNQAACDAAREEEDAAIAEQAELDARAGITNTDPNDLLPLNRRPNDTTG